MFSSLLENPEAGVMGAYFIKSYILFLYQVTSTEALLLNMLTIVPISKVSADSGRRSAPLIVVGRDAALREPHALLVME
ncbi:MAG: hypothetical protein BWY89_01377 [Bacteroidetes bacterium ADurb.BinA012]|nr:MAG: hypothetical protein BWY89_01377 [Bacteroidetes bacterium ADurb.BinA012]